MSQSELTLEVSGAVATLTMNRPAARNALSAGMKEAFAEAVPRIAGDPSIRAVILTGSGGVFCAGGDLRAMLEARGSMSTEGWRDRMRDVHPWLAQLVQLDRPLIAAVDGAAYGAGFSLALTADFVIATPAARFCLSFMRVGLAPDFAAMYTLPRVVGIQRAKELMLSAREVAADEALRLGIVMEVVPADGLLARSHELAQSFAGASPLAVSLVKQNVGMALASDLGRALDREANEQALCFTTAAHQAAVDRFLAKQPAAFQWPVRSGGG